MTTEREAVGPLTAEEAVWIADTKRALADAERAARAPEGAWDTEHSVIGNCPECDAAIGTLSCVHWPAPEQAAQAEPGHELHRLLWPPHPGDAYLSSALCSCGEYQYDADTGTDLFNAMRDVLSDWTAHVRAALEAHGEPGLDLGPRCRGGTPDGACDDEMCAAHGEQRPDEACIGDPSHQYHSHDDDPLDVGEPQEGKPDIQDDLRDLERIELPEVGR